MSLDEFRAWDDGTDIRYELIDGVPMAMAPTSGRHAEMAVNISHLFAGRLARPFRAASGAGVRIPRRDDLHLVPDLVVTCASPPYDKTWAVELRLVSEIFSPSTSR